MYRAIVRLVVFPAVAAALGGCSDLDLGPWGGSAYQLDTEKVGTGQQTISSRNDAEYWNGQPTDHRPRR
jgi:hypothetical protein